MIDRENMSLQGKEVRRMKHSFKKRILCALTAFCLILASFLPAVTSYGESENSSEVSVLTEADGSPDVGSAGNEDPAEDGKTPAVHEEDPAVDKKVPAVNEEDLAVDEKAPAVEEDTELEHRSIEVYPDRKDREKMVTLEGLMPKDAKVKAVDVTSEYAAAAEGSGRDSDPAQEEETAEKGNVITTTIAAYDITILDGEEEYQPGEEHPVSVEISDARISSDADLGLWHIRDDGIREEITDFTVEDGKVSFDAAGFSVYKIVEKELVPKEGEGEQQITDMDGFKAHAAGGIYIAHPDSRCFVSDTMYNVNDKRTGIQKTAPQEAGQNPIYDHTDIKPALYYFLEQTDGKYKIYCNTADGIRYVKQAGNSLSLVPEAAEATSFTVNKYNDTTGQFVIVGNNGYCWNQQGGASGKGFAAYNNSEDVNAKLAFYYYVPMSDDPFHLDGHTIGLMHYSGGSSGDALMATEGTNNLSMMPVSVRTGDGATTYFTTNDTDISLWTFHYDTDDRYYLSASSGGTEKYLKIDENGLSLVDSAGETSSIRISKVAGDRFIFSDPVSGRVLVYDPVTGFSAGEKANAAMMNFVQTVEPDEGSYVPYTAEKVSISDVPNGAEVIVYTRVWDDSRKTYDFFAIDHDGTLHPCYERGDNIMWIGDPINTLLWDFTEYYYSDGSINHYYELQNQYSGKFLAPQIGGGQALSDGKIGINLPGRRLSKYYSEIIAWDEAYYSYAALLADGEDKNIVSGPLKNAGTFYFATIKPTEPTLTEVPTVDNGQYGITMKMVDFKDRAEQETVLGDTSGAHGFNPLQGILSTNLASDGYPTTEADKSLKELFGKAKDVNHLFLQSTYEASGYFEYNSCENFASLKGKTEGDFTVYKELGTMDKRTEPTDKHGQFMPYNDITAGVYSTNNPYNLNDISGKPLPESDPRKYELLHRVGKYNDTSGSNWNFGMELEASFVQTPSGMDDWGHDIIFEFTGDDDFWLYVDGELVIDLGGVHSALPGNVNFSTGDVSVNGTKTTLRELFTQNYLKRNPTLTVDSPETKAFLAEYFDGSETVFKDYSSHSMKIFYMERGLGASNLHMRFNLSYVTPGNVVFSKEVTGSDDMDFDLVKYPFQIYYRDEEYQLEHLLSNTDSFIGVKYQNFSQEVEYAASYTPPGSTHSYDSVFFLYPGKPAEIHFPSKAIAYRVVECGINSEVYDKVYINETELAGTDVSSGTDLSMYTYDSGWHSVEEFPRAAFTNHVNPDGLRTLSFQKKLVDEHGQPISAENDPTTYDFRLYLSDGVHDTLKLANMANYYVRDPQGYYCTWDAGLGKFVPSEYNDVTAFTKQEGDSEEVIAQKAARKETLTFQTSMNGAISKIPAWYKVEVPNLTVGMRFKVQEKYSEIALGYGRINYERDESTYIREPGDADNEGRVRAGFSPVMNVLNQRGYSLEVRKVWSDNAFTKTHEPIYMAVYKGAESQPVAKSVRELKYPDTYIRYFIGSLAAGESLDDYKVYEVEVSGGTPVVNEDGVVTNADQLTIRRLENGDSTWIDATASNSDTPKAYEYVVNVKQGETGKSIDSLDADNYRIDTVTNTRKGGIAITLYDMNTRAPLANGTFTLKKWDAVEEKYVAVGTYKSDAEGKITILYEYARDPDYYILTETASPAGYRGLPNDLQFKVMPDDTLEMSGNEEKWQTVRYPQDASDKLTAYIDVYNKPFVIEVYKFDGASLGTGGLKKAYFDLYRGVKGLGGIVKDKAPLTGYENMETGENGIITGINCDLAPNTYFLTEKTPPAGYEGLDGDVVFKITPLGEMKLVKTPKNSNVVLEETEDPQQPDTYRYLLKIPNSKLGGDVKLTVTKTVHGNMGNKEKPFIFTFNVDGDDGTGDKSYEWTKNGETQATALKSGGTFTLSHGEEAVIMVPDGSKVTITEANEDYHTTIQLGEEEPEVIHTKTFMVDDDITLAFLNKRDGLIPTGVWMSFGGMALLAGALCLGMVLIWRRKKHTEKFLQELKNRR